MNKPQLSPVGAAVVAWGQAVELLESIYQSQHGEVDEGTEAAEHYVELAGVDALESLARFVRFCEDGLDALKRESERIAIARDRIDRRIAWATAEGVRILADLGAKSKAAGPFKVGAVIGAVSVHVDAEFDLSTAPDEIVRVVPAVPEGRVLDKKAAKKYLQGDELPVPGLELVRGPSRFTIA